MKTEDCRSLISTENEDTSYEMRVTSSWNLLPALTYAYNNQTTFRNVCKLMKLNFKTRAKLWNYIVLIISIKMGNVFSNKKSLFPDKKLRWLIILSKFHSFPWKRASSNIFLNITLKGYFTLSLQYKLNHQINH